MTLIALTECCRLLAIDGKTLRRWLAQAQLPVQAHPSDARCKGLSSEHLLLARAHHRRLAALPQEELAPPAPAETSSELTAELLTALQTLSTLPAQMAALQQHLADLTALVQQPPVSVTSPLPNREPRGWLRPLRPRRRPGLVLPLRHARSRLRPRLRCYRSSNMGSRGPTS